VNNYFAIIVLARRKITDNVQKDEVIDLTDGAGTNQMKVVRSKLDSKSEHLGAFADSPIHIIPEDKGYLESKLLRKMPEDPEPDFERQLEAEGAQVIESITHFPASNTTLIKRSQTPAERVEQRILEYYNK
jgi:hypothetical protein